MEIPVRIWGSIWCRAWKTLHCAVGGLQVGSSGRDARVYGARLGMNVPVSGKVRWGSGVFCLSTMRVSTGLGAEVYNNIIIGLAFLYSSSISGIVLAECWLAVRLWWFGWCGSLGSRCLMVLLHDTAEPQCQGAPEPHILGAKASGDLGCWGLRPDGCQPRDPTVSIVHDSNELL